MNNKQKRIRVVSVNHSQGGRVPSVGSNERGGAPSSEGVVSIRRERERDWSESGGKMTRNS